MPAYDGSTQNDDFEVRNRRRLLVADYYATDESAAAWAAEHEVDEEAAPVPGDASSPLQRQSWRIQVRNQVQLELEVRLEVWLELLVQLLVQLGISPGFSKEFPRAARTAPLARLRRLRLLAHDARRARAFVLAHIWDGCRVHESAQHVSKPADSAAATRVSLAGLARRSEEIPRHQLVQQ